MLFFWFNDWLNQGKLSDILGEDGTRNFGLHRLAKVAEAATAEGWSIRRQRGVNHRDLQYRLPSAALGEDCVVWKFQERDYREMFSSSKTWELIRT